MQLMVEHIMTLSKNPPSWEIMFAVHVSTSKEEDFDLIQDQKGHSQPQKNVQNGTKQYKWGPGTYKLSNTY